MPPAHLCLFCLGFCQTLRCAVGSANPYFVWAPILLQLALTLMGFTMTQSDMCEG